MVSLTAEELLKVREHALQQAIQFQRIKMDNGLHDEKHPTSSQTVTVAKTFEKYLTS